MEVKFNIPIQLKLTIIMIDLSLVSLVLVNRDDINKGKYTISAFVDGVYSGATTVKLK